MPDEMPSDLVTLITEMLAPPPGVRPTARRIVVRLEARPERMADSRALGEYLDRHLPARPKAPSPPIRTERTIEAAVRLDAQLVDEPDRPDDSGPGTADPAPRRGRWLPWAIAIVALLLASYAYWSPERPGIEQAAQPATETTESRPDIAIKIDDPPATDTVAPESPDGPDDPPAVVEPPPVVTPPVVIDDKASGDGTSAPLPAQISNDVDDARPRAVRSRARSRRPKTTSERTWKQHWSSSSAP